MALFTRRLRHFDFKLQTIVNQSVRNIKTPTVLFRDSCLRYNCKPYSTEAQSNSTGSREKLVNITPAGIAVLCLSVGGGYFYYRYLEQLKIHKSSADRISVLSEIGTLNWTLTDQNEKLRTYSEFRGRWLMIYFGFCHCPDICPEELEKLADVCKKIDDAGLENITPIFITLDPARDTPSFIKTYCADFSSKMIGLTGTTEEISEAAKSYRVYYGFGDKDEDGDYIVDHTICMYLINPDGQLIDVYQRRATVDQIVRGTTLHMKEYPKLQKFFKTNS